MKLIKLAFYRIIHYFEENRLIFLLYLLGSITCVITFIYFYGNTVSTKHAEASNSLMFRQYEVKLDAARNLNADDFAFLQGYEVDDILLQSPELGDTVLAQAPGEDKQEITSSHGSKVRVKAYLHDNTKINPIKGRADFTKEELEAGNNIAIAPNDFADSLNGDENILIGEVPYRLIGATILPSGFILPYNTYLKNQYPTAKFTVTLHTIPSIADSNAFAQKLYAAFPNSSISDPASIYDKNVQSLLPASLLLIAAVYIISLASFLFILKYLMDKNSSENIIYSMVGAAKKTVMAIIVIENLLLSSFSAVIGTVLHASLYGSFFCKINSVENVVYYWTDYALLFVFVLVLSLLTAIPFLISYWRSTIIQSKNKYN